MDSGRGLLRSRGVGRTFRYNGLGMLAFPLLAVVAGVGLVLALFGSFYMLLCWDLMLSYYQGFWTLGGTRVDYTDVMIGCMVLALVLRGRRTEGEPFKLPYFKAWLTLAAFLTVCYLVHPQNQRNLTDPVRILYQLYRYCWKPLAYYPLVVLLLRDTVKIDRALTCMVLGFDACAILAIRQGYIGFEATPGPFGHGNAFASILVAPFMVCFGRLFYEKSKPMLAFSGISLALMARALLFSESRAGMASVALSVAAFAGLMATTPSGRKRLSQLAPLAVAGALALLAVRPDLLLRPSVQHAMSVTDGTRASTMQWRMTERWPHFINLAIGSPILGTGTAVDESLGDAANTPHNGYIALAVRYGFPVAILYIFFGFGAFYNGVRAFLQTKATRTRLMAATLAAPLTGILAHNMIESTITAKELLQNFFWILVGLNAVLRFQGDKLLNAEEREALDRRRRKAEEEAWVNGWATPQHADGRAWNLGDDWENDPPPSWSDGPRDPPGDRPPRDRWADGVVGGSTGDGGPMDPWAVPDRRP